MKLKNRLICGLMGIVMLLSATGCSTTAEKYIAEVDGEQIPVGIYLYQLHSAYNDAKSRVEDKEKDVLSQQIDGKDSAVWIEETAIKYLKEYLAAEKLFTEYNLVISGAVADNIKDTAELYWVDYKVGEVMEERGISKESYSAILANSTKKNMVFEYYYGDNGVEPITEKELEDALKSDYLYMQYLVIPFVDQLGEDLTEEKLAEEKKIGEEYLTRVKNGEDFNTIIIENETRLETTHEDHASDEDAHIFFDNKNYINLGEGFQEKYDAAAIGDVFSFENESNYMIFNKLDVTSDPTNLTDVRGEITQTVKSESFAQVLLNTAEEILTTATLNQAAVKEYNVKNLKGLE